ncbi:hypothetical protein OH76DRAFT_1490834 [Lentinus brumalis]|uniref:Uncharacterized protein n=1 Tax=Lentinus brumalis TaxID=2498619 RepID=A0A371CHM6_9APHY|nr:hypothetical protein OH76DRAFT_1490834 [Polyporus brumalis]
MSGARRFLLLVKTRPKSLQVDPRTIKFYKYSRTGTSTELHFTATGVHAATAVTTVVTAHPSVVPTPSYAPICHQIDRPARVVITAHLPATFHAIGVTKINLPAPVLVRVELFRGEDVGQPARTTRGGDTDGACNPDTTRGIHRGEGETYLVGGCDNHEAQTNPIGSGSSYESDSRIGGRELVFVSSRLPSRNKGI